MTSQPKQPSWPNNATFWRDQRVTVTGGAGFLGSFVVEKLRERGAPPCPPILGETWCSARRCWPCCTTPGLT